jgi:hypothetical protein
MKVRKFENVIQIGNLKTCLVKKNFCSRMQMINFPKVSLIQRPGDSYIRNITLIPGEGIGRELVSKI